MLEEMLMDLIQAKGKKARERAYKRLEKVGVDRRTAWYMAMELKKEAKANDDQ